MLARNHKGCTHYNTCMEANAWLSIFAEGNNFHAVASKSSSYRKSSKTVSTFRPLLLTPEIEQTWDQPQEYWAKPKSLMQEHQAGSWVEGCTHPSGWKKNCHNPAHLTLLWQGAVQNAYFRHRNRSKCPNYLFSKPFPLATGKPKRTVSGRNDTEIRKFPLHTLQQRYSCICKSAGIKIWFIFFLKSNFTSKITFS